MLIAESKRDRLNEICAKNITDGADLGSLVQYFLEGQREHFESLSDEEMKYEMITCGLEYLDEENLLFTQEEKVDA